MAGGARGERAIVTEAGEVRVLYTNRALVEAERAMGKSVLSVAQGFADGESGITEVMHLLQAGMEAARHDARQGGRRVSPNDALRLMDEIGFAGIAAPVMEAVVEVLSYDPADADEYGDDDPN